MDKIKKALKKLNVKERKAIKRILSQLLKENYINLDIKKLKGEKDIFRVRKGSVRIIYRLKDGDIYILTIERRSDTTYSK